MSQRAVEDCELIVCIGDRRIVVSPHEDVDLGPVDPKHKLISGYAQKDEAMVPYAIVLSDIGPVADAG